MAVFFVYSPDGGECSLANMEYSPNAENVKRELAARVRTGRGHSCFVADMPETGLRGAREAYAESEWPEATRDAYMAVWRCRTSDVPSGSPTEVWTYSGTVDRPLITPVDTVKGVAAFGERKTLEEWANDRRMRVSVSTFTQRIRMGWQVETAMSTPLGQRAGTVRETSGKRWGNQTDLPEGALPSQRVVHTAFGVTRTIPEWSRATGLGQSALRNGIARYGGLEGYLRSKGWRPRRA